MRYILLLAPVCILFYSCNKDDIVSQEKEYYRAPPPPSYKICLYNYGESFDGLYKKFSDSSWYKYYVPTRIGNLIYDVITYSDNTNSYYLDGKFAGFDLTNHDRILFDFPLEFLPESIQVNVPYKRSTTFQYRNYLFTYAVTHTLLETLSVSIPIGNFTKCIKMKSTLKISSSGESQSREDVYILGRGVGLLMLQYGAYFVRGTVNGVHWPRTDTAVTNHALKPHIASSSFFYGRM